MKKQISKTLIACLLMLVMVVGMLPMSVFAYPITIDNVKIQVPPDKTFTDNRVTSVTLEYPSASGASIRKTLHCVDLHSVAETKGEVAMGTPAYCIEPGVASGIGLSAVQDPNHMWSRFSENQRNALRLVFAYGAPNGMAETDGFEVATQIVIWEIISGLRDPVTFDLKDAKLSNAALNWTKGYPSVYADYTSGYSFLVNKCKQHKEVPSFGRDSQSAAEQNPYTMRYDSATKTYSVTLTDTNNVTSTFKKPSVEGLNVKIAGNKVTFSCSADAFKDKDIPVIESTGHTIDQTHIGVMFAQMPGKQAVCVSKGGPDPVTIYVKLVLEKKPSPILHTTATLADGTKIGYVNGNVTINDGVRCSNLEVGTTYRLVGSLHDLQGNLISENCSATDEFTATEETMTRNVAFTAPANVINNRSDIVVYEELFAIVDGEPESVAQHFESDNKDQTVSFKYPTISTSATFIDGSKTSYRNEELTVKDTVSYKNLLTDVPHTISGCLKTQDASGKVVDVLDADGNPVTASASFTPSKSDGDVTLTYTFNASKLDAKKLVAYAVLTYNGTQMASHQDIGAESQTVTIPTPSISTKATFDDDTTVKHKTGKVTVVDTVTYSDVIPNESYEIRGCLMTKDKEGRPVKILVDGKEITAADKFTASAASGERKLKYTFNCENLETDVIVVFEELIHLNRQYEGGEKTIATHQNINDRGQTVYFENPTISTTAHASNGEQTTHTAAEMTIIDTVSYTNLIVGKEYTINGTLMTKDADGNGKELLINGKPVTSSVTFKAEQENGEIEMVFTFDGSAIKTETIVVFEDLYEGDIKLYAHADINDADQTVTVTPPTIKTFAMFADESKLHDALSEVEIIDRVSLENLNKDQTYQVRGTLIVQDGEDEEGNPIFVELKDENDQIITSIVNFTADGKTAEIDVPFTINATELLGQKIVVFEELYETVVGKDEEGNETVEVKVQLAEHKDIEDEDQTVEINNPTAKTVAVFISNNGHTYQLKTIKEKEKRPSEVVKVTDTISYTGLTPGITYTATGTAYVIKAETKDAIEVEELKQEDKPVSVTVEFTPETADGTVEVPFEFEAKDLENKSVVFYEIVMRDEDVIVRHEDPTDKDQTVNFLRTVKTGIMPDWAWLAMAGGLLGVAVALYFVLRAYKKKNSK